MQMPRNKFDTHAACARMDADTTLHHRERWPSLAFVWDELDDLRAESQTAVDSKDHASVEKELQEALDELDEMRLALKTVLGALDDIDAVRSAAETVMMGGGA